MFDRICAKNADKKKKFLTDNNGSVLVTVVIVVMFLTILATALIYVSSMSFQIKATDYKNTRSFYQCETALENIKAQLTVDASDAYLRVYKEMLPSVTSYPANAAGIEFNRRFIDELVGTDGYWTGITHGAGLLGGTENWLAAYSNSFGSTMTFDQTTNVTYNIVPNPDGLGFIISDEMTGIITMRGIEVTYTDPEGYTSIIETDITIVPSMVDWNGSVAAYVYAPAGGGPVDPVEQAKNETFNQQVRVYYSNWKKK